MYYGGLALRFDLLAEVQGLEDMFRRLERRMNTQRRSPSTQKNYARHLAQISLHYKGLPTVLSDDQIEDYLEGLILKGAQCNPHSFNITV